MKSTTKDPRTKLLADLDRIAKRMKRRGAAQKALYKAINDDLEEQSRIRAALHRLDLAELLNVPNAVKLRFRHSSGKLALLNDVPATLTKLGRTRCDIDFANGSRWEMSIADVAPANAEQGLFVEFSLGGCK